MFKKLRNRFLILNLVIISVVMLISFSSIYLLTYKDTRAKINSDLHKISEGDRKASISKGDLGMIKGDPNADKGEPKLGFDNIGNERKFSNSFVLITDEEWNVQSIECIIEMDKDFYETLKDAALSKSKVSGNLKQDDVSWAFLIRPQLEGGYKIVFLDITNQQYILTKLIYIFIAVSLITLVFIFLISKFFANKAIKPIKEAFDKQKQFIADASHELKTPLAVINTNVDVLLSNSEDTIDSQSKWLHYIKSESERMSKLTNDLLYLTQVDYSDVKMIFSDFNLSETVENVILTMEAVVFESGLTLDYDIQPNITAHGNSEQIKQVVMILLDNAIKYSNNKGKINLNLSKSSNGTTLSVTNTGKGIPEEHIEKIFDRFYRTDKSRTRESGGYGLGLAIAKAIVEQHGGKISAKSVLNESTTFTVRLS